jgi:hypothetical protein
MSADYAVSLARSRERASSGYSPYVSIRRAECSCGWTALFGFVRDELPVEVCRVCDMAGLTWLTVTIPAWQLPEYVEAFETKQKAIRALPGLTQPNGR